MTDRACVLMLMRQDLPAQLFGPHELTRLERVCDILTTEPVTDLTAAGADELLALTDVFLTSWGAPPIDTSILDRAPRLKAIVHAAGTVKGLQASGCWDRGIQVTSAAPANAMSVAEYTLSAILLSLKRAFFISRRFSAARAWVDHSGIAGGVGSFGRTVGIVGASHVGRRVMELLRPFDVRVLLHDPFAEESTARDLGAKLTELDELMSGSDVVSLHAPALDSTRHMIDRVRLGLMRDGSTLINTARGWLVDHAALSEELESGRLFAVIDTSEPEPLPADSPLYDLPNVFLTPHIAGAMGTELRRLGELAVREIERLVTRRPLVNPVRIQDLDRLA